MTLPIVNIKLKYDFVKLGPSDHSEKRRTPSGLCSNDHEVLAPVTEVFREKVVTNKILNEVYQDPILPPSLCSLLVEC